MTPPLAGYTRVSRIGDRKGTLISHDDQRQRIAAYAASHGREIDFLPEESDVSGGKADRPILAEALEGVEGGRYGGIIVAQLDRLSRMQLTEALSVIRRVEDAGGQVVAVAENFDDSTPEGRMGRNVFLSMAEMQLDRYKAQFARAKQQAVERGIWPVPTVPLGYRRRDDRRLEPDPRNAKRVVAAFEARADGKPWSEVAKVLGVGLSTAGKIIRNRAYVGEIRIGEIVNPKGIEQPLVSPDLFEAAQRRHPRPPRGVHPRALLAGVARCAGCGGALTASSSPKKGYTERIYRCVNNKANGRCSAPAIIAQRKLEAYVEELTLEEIGRLAATARERTDALERAQEALRAAEAELEAYQLVVTVSELGADVFEAGMRTRLERVEHARRALGQARAASAQVPEPRTLTALWPELSVEERHRVLRGAIGAVYVRRGRGPASERVRVIAPGFEPAPLAPRERLALRPVDGDLPGEIGPAGA